MSDMATPRLLGNLKKSFGIGHFSQLLPVSAFDPRDLLKVTNGGFATRHVILGAVIDPCCSARGGAVPTDQIKRPPPFRATLLFISRSGLFYLFTRPKEDTRTAATTSSRRRVSRSETLPPSLPLATGAIKNLRFIYIHYTVLFINGASRVRISENPWRARDSLMLIQYSKRKLTYEIAWNLEGISKNLSYTN